MVHPVQVASAQILQDVQREVVRQGYETPVCTYFETLYTPRALVDGTHGAVAGWLLLIEAEATAPLSRRSVRLRAAVTPRSGIRHIEIRVDG